jgi:hypothetical protein
MRGVLSKIGLYIIGAIIGLLLLELFYQLVEIQLPYHELNERLGKKMIPGRRINYFKEGFYLGASNEYGYLGNPYPPARNNNKIRIALLGDSFVEGFHVFEDHHFDRILEKKLNKDKAGQGYEIMNFGVGNYSYNDMVIQYKNYIEDFDPDILLFIVSDRDFQFREDFFIPSPVLKMKDDSLVIDYSFTDGRTYRIYNRLSFLMNNSCVVKALNNVYKMTGREAFKQVLFDKLYRPDVVESEFPISMDQETELDIRIFKSIEWFKDKKVFFVFKQDASEELMQEFENRGVICSIADAVLMRELGDKGINYKYWDVTNTYGHWNHAAQEVVGEHLYRMIKQYEE